MTVYVVAMTYRLIALVLFLGACSGSTSDSDDSDNATPAADAAQSFDGAPSSSELCYPAGIYGVCADTDCPMCMAGASIYNTCSSSCTDNADCGSAADFAGAMPTCAPLNPGADEKICVLTCTSTEECPCGLECRASGVPNINICATTL